MGKRLRTAGIAASVLGVSFCVLSEQDSSYGLGLLLLLGGLIVFAAGRVAKDMSGPD